MEWLTEKARESVGSLHHGLKAVEKDVPKKAAVPFASLLTALLQVLAAIDAFLDALRSRDNDAAPPPPAPAAPKAGSDEEEETPDRDTPPRR